jgi:hypothetical protein
LALDYQNKRLNGGNVEIKRDFESISANYAGLSASKGNRIPTANDEKAGGISDIGRSVS